MTRHLREPSGGARRCTLWASNVFWQPVGALDDEVVVIREQGDAGEETSGMEAFLVKGELAAAWWSRMDGAEEHSDEALVTEACAALGGNPDAVRAAFGLFVDHLRGSGLVGNEGELCTRTMTPGQREYPFPASACDLSSPQGWLSPMELGSLVSRDLVALGTFVGGTNNVSTLNPCTGQSGGIQNEQTSGACIPGTGFGYFNLGWYGRRC